MVLIKSIRSLFHELINRSNQRHLQLSTMTFDHKDTDIDTFANFLYYTLRSDAMFLACVIWSQFWFETVSIYIETSLYNN